MQNSIHKIKYLLFLSWDWEAWCLTVWEVIHPPSERNTAWNKGRKCFHCLGVPNNLIRPCHRVLELSEVRAEYTLSLLHKPTIHSAYQQSIKTDYSLPFIHKNIIWGEEKDRQNCDNIFTIEAAACFGLCTRKYQMYRWIIA